MWSKNLERYLALRDASIEIDYFTPENGEDLAISNLLSNTEYSYVMTLTDFSGNSVTTQSKIFKTSILESDPPQIIVNSPADIGSDQATIRIQTNESLSRVILTLLPADSLIPQEFKFGSSADLTREFTLTGLRPGVSYYYFVTVIDASGNMTQSVSHGEFHTSAI